MPTKPRAAGYRLFLSMRMDSRTFHCLGRLSLGAPLLPYITPLSPLLPPHTHMLQLRRFRQEGKVAGPAASSAPESCTSNVSYF